MRNSKIILCHNINLDRDYVNVLDYSENQMLELCNSNKVAELNTFSFIRQSRNRIATSFDYSIVLKANYMAFQNPDYSNKWFFAFVDDVIWKGENNTEIVFTIDSWSTWFHETTVKSCFVSREHVNDDTIGLNTVPENLDVGEVISDNLQTVQMSSRIAVGVLTNYKPEINGAYKLFDGITYFGRLIFGSGLFVFQTNDLSALRAFIKRSAIDAHTDDIRDIFLLPRKHFR